MEENKVDYCGGSNNKWEKEVEGEEAS